MKKLFFLFLIFAGVLFLSGCANEENKEIAWKELSKEEANEELAKLLEEGKAKAAENKNRNYSVIDNETRAEIERAAEAILKSSENLSKKRNTTTFNLDSETKARLEGELMKGVKIPESKTSQLKNEKESQKVDKFKNWFKTISDKISKLFKRKLTEKEEEVLALIEKQGSARVIIGFEVERLHEQDSIDQREEKIARVRKKVILNLVEGEDYIGHIKVFKYVPGFALSITSSGFDKLVRENTIELSMQFDEVGRAN